MGDFGKSVIEQQILRRACTYVQARLSLCCMHTQGMDVDEDSDQNLYLAKLNTPACVFNKDSFCTCDMFKNFMYFPQNHLKCICESV